MARNDIIEQESELIEGLGCPRCGSTDVAGLPADGISPNPGYRCVSCGAKLRGMTWTYVVVILVGIVLLGVAAGVIQFFGDDRDETLRGFVLAPLGAWSTFLVVPLYVVVVLYGFRHLLRPRPVSNEEVTS